MARYGTNGQYFGTKTTIHGMIDAHVHHNSLATWPAQIGYVLIDAPGKPSLVTRKNSNGKVIINKKDIWNHLTEVIADYIVGLNTGMYKYSSQGKENERYMPSLIIASTMDMDLAHLDGYDGVFIESIDHANNLCHQRWDEQIKNTKLAVECNPLRLFPLFSYDPRRYRYSENDKNSNRITMLKNCGSWKDPFWHIVGHSHTNSDIKKYWIGFRMDPTLGFRPFDECCTYLSTFYKECANEKNPIPILAHCTPEGFIAHNARDYKKFDGKKLTFRIETSSSRKHHCTSMYYGTERVVDNDDLDYFYMNYGHPRNWVPVLEHCPTLHLCLAGFGGNSEWRHESMLDWAQKKDATLPPREWIRCIIKITRYYKNVYVDISGLDIKNNVVNDGLKKILRLIKDNHKEFKHLKYKLIFGSGWYHTPLTDVSNGAYSYGDYCDTFKNLFYKYDDDKKSGEFWELVSLINPWHFYALSGEKIDKLYKEINGDENVLENIKGVFDDHNKITVKLANYVSSRNPEKIIASLTMSGGENDDDLKSRSMLHSIDVKMITEIRKIYWGMKVVWRGEPFIKDCYHYALVAIKNAYETMYNNFDDNYRFNHSVIAGNWEKSLIKVNNPKDVTKKERDDGDRLLKDFDTDPTINKFMLDYIKRCIDKNYPVLIGVSAQCLAVKMQGDGKYKMINDGVTEHFLVLTSYTVQNNNVIGLGGIDNATNPVTHINLIVESDGKKIYKPSTNENSENTIDKEYQVTQVRMWAEVCPSDYNAIKKQSWGSWGLDWWKKN